MTRRPPWPLVAAGLLGALLLLLPLIGLLVRVPWSSAAETLTTPAALDALRLSLLCAGGATALSLVLGVPLAWLLTRPGLPGRRALRLLVAVPLVLPPVVGGLALLVTFGRHGVLAGVLPFDLPFTTAGVVVAEAFVAMPFLVLTVDGALRAQDGRLQEMAATLGLRPWSRFWRIDLPAARTGLIAGTSLCFARALGEFGATITFAGSLQGTTRTLPLASYLALETDPSQAVALSLLLMVVSVLVLLGLRGSWVPQVRR